MLKNLKLKSLVQKKFFQVSKLSEFQKFNNSFLSASSATYIENMYNKWLADNKSVHSSWDAYFHNDANNLPDDQMFCATNNLGQGDFQNTQQDVYETIRIQMLRLAYQQYGHFISTIDPLKLDRKIYQTPELLEKYEEACERLKPEYYGFKQENMEKEYTTYYQNQGGMCRDVNSQKLKSILEKLQKTYTQNVGYEFNFIDDLEQKNWILDKIENDQFLNSDKARKQEILEYLCENETLNLFLKNKFPTSKRFGIEGCDTTISALKALVSVAGTDKVDHLVFGMAHRGRLNTLSLVIKKPLEEIFAEFRELKYEQSHVADQEWGKAGDVKYHLGMTNDLKLENDHSIRLTILPNPSHLETVNPVVYGKVKAHQDFDNDGDQNKNIGILLHGDAAHAGQGIVYETYQFQDLKQYSSGGVIHIITNNQIGFTTAQRDARSGLYCTEVAKTIMAPIFHVNSDDPEMVDKIMRLAFDFRQKFKRDVVIDIVGYRRLGHNELDQPAFTQPLMYQKINNMPNVYELYSQQLQKEGILSNSQKQELENKFNQTFNQAYEKSNKDEIQNHQWVLKQYEEIKTPTLWGKVKDTGVPLDVLKSMALKICEINGVEAHPQIVKIYEQRKKSILNGGIDFGTAEALAFSSLLHEGYGVRLSGQDVERGTFSHRHSVIHDQKISKSIRPIDQCLTPEVSKKFTVSNSHLSEYGVLGFEYGYNIANPNYLVIWEAQFGDFSNTCQIMIDNYITCGEAKWKLQSGLVMLLPHGMDGNGPEHSSARLERYLQLSDDDYKLQQILTKDKNGRLMQQINNVNFQLACPTTSYNYFHLLRRQMRRQYRKPLIVFTSKKLLRFKPATSKLEDFQEGLRFKWVIEDDLPVEPIKKVILCCGQVYYDLFDKRKVLNRNDVAIVRLEQLSPFPYNDLQKELEKYPNATINWCQEEHMNQGAWGFVKSRIQIVLDELKRNNDIQYFGRIQSASSATGSSKLHQEELQKFLNETFQE